MAYLAIVWLYYWEVELEQLTTQHYVCPSTILAASIAEGHQRAIKENERQLQARCRRRYVRAHTQRPCTLVLILSPLLPF